MKDKVAGIYVAIDIKIVTVVIEVGQETLSNARETVIVWIDIKYPAITEEERERKKV